MLRIAAVLVVVCALIAQAATPVTALADDWTPGPGASGRSTLSGFIDQPLVGSTITSGSPFQVRGWIVDTTAQGWAGIDEVHLYLGRAGEGGRLLAKGRVAVARPDVASALGNPYWAASGFLADVSPAELPAGTATLYVYAHTPNKGWWTKAFTVNVIAFGYTVIEAPGNDTQFWCLRSNPSCGRDPWWVEWDETQRGDPVQFRFLGPGLVSEHRFAEATVLLWAWPEGRALLQHAASNGVRVETWSSDTFSSAFAAYMPGRNLLRVNRQYTETSTWLLADILAHELQHANDDWAGQYQRKNYSDCITLEQRAFHTELRYLNWLDARFGGLPNPWDVASRLSHDDYYLYMNLYSVFSRRDLDAQVIDMYRQQCG